MSQDKDGPSKRGRRGFQVDGAQATRPRAPKARSIDAALRLDVDEPPTLAEGETAYNPQRVRAFLKGRITLGDLEGITKQEQYQMAEVGHSYLSSGKLDEAKTVFEGLVALDPFDAYFHTALGSVAQQQGDLEAADKRYTRALEINPYSVTAMAHRGEVRVTQGRLSEGTEDLIRAVQADPQGKDPAAVRAQATLNVLRDQLAAAASGGDASSTAARSPSLSRPAVGSPPPRPRASSPGAPRPRGPAAGPSDSPARGRRPTPRKT